MNAEDMVLISIDDHIIEPPGLFDRHMPEKYREQAPQMHTDENGVDTWIFQGEVVGTAGLAAVASWPVDEWHMDPAGLSEMRPGCYDVKERVRDMNANGLLASLNFPTMPGFAGTWLAGCGDKALAAIAIAAYNDWHMDEFAASMPGRIIPQAIGPLFDREALVEEIHRCGRKGFTSISLPETPYQAGLPSFYGDHWDPVFRALCDHDMAVNMHIGGAFRLLQLPEDATMDQRIVLSPQLSAVAATDLMVSGTFRKFPDLRVAFSEGGIGWIPFLLDRVDRHVSNQSWTGLDLGAESATELWRRKHVGLFHYGSLGAPPCRAGRRRDDRVGMRLPAFGLDLAALSRESSRGVRRRGCERRLDSQDHVGEFGALLSIRSLRASLARGSDSGCAASASDRCRRFRDVAQGLSRAISRENGGVVENGRRRTTEVEARDSRETARRGANPVSCS